VGEIRPSAHQQCSVQIMQRAQLIPAAVLKREVAYAGFLRRLLAHLIDMLVIGAVGVTLGALVIAVAPDNFTALANVAPVTAAIGWAYYVLFESSPARGTLGKIALNLFVGDVHGDPISYPRAAFRYFFKIFSTLLLGLGWFMAAFTPQAGASRRDGGHAGPSAGDLSRHRPGAANRARRLLGRGPLGRLGPAR